MDITCVETVHGGETALGKTDGADEISEEGDTIVSSVIILSIGVIGAISSVWVGGCVCVSAVADTDVLHSLLELQPIVNMGYLGVEVGC